MSLDVRIRYASEASSRYLCEIPFDDIDDLIPTIKGWGLAGLDTVEMSGQFCMTDTSAFFELVVHDDDA